MVARRTNEVALKYSSSHSTFSNGSSPLYFPFYQPINKQSNEQTSILQWHTLSDRVQPQLSNSDYTQHKVYHIKTEDENYPHARKAIASIMEDELGYKQGEIWNKGLYQLKNDKEPSC